MYCTVVQGPLSTSLGDDESAAYLRFRRMAQTLGSISRSFNELSRSTTAAYLTALRRPSAELWTPFFENAALLVERANALRATIPLNAKDREALEFFEAIVRENADLLPAHSPLAAKTDVDDNVLTFAMTS